ncbi:hypothetical protein EDB85DRAFT_1885407 [Lactarius pseudohatsudake]|nr:hypothetical protein EDB85DRAFT_1885407 [Lactarius pseudohatsudake]
MVLPVSLTPFKTMTLFGAIRATPWEKDNSFAEKDTNPCRCGTCCTKPAHSNKVFVLATMLDAECLRFLVNILKKPHDNDDGAGNALVHDKSGGAGGFEDHWQKLVFGDVVKPPRRAIDV